MDRKIAVEEHFVTPDHEEYVSKEWMSAETHRRVIRRLSDISDERIAEMDRCGIELAVLSLVTEGVQAEPDAARAVLQAARANDALAAIIDRHRGRFAGFATVALQDPRAAERELDRAIGELGLRAVCLNGYTTSPDGGLYYDDDRFLAFFEHLAGLGVPLFLHPRYPLRSQRGIYEGRPELLGSTWGFGVETATHALRMITSGLFDRVPGLQVILGHLGETLPFALYRMQGRLKALNGHRLERPAPAYLRENFYVSTSGNFHTASLIGVLLELGADRVLFAVDYPFEEMGDASTWFDSAPIADADRDKIGRRNAQTLFGLTGASECPQRVTANGS